jgi:hypothetical protein
MPSRQKVLAALRVPFAPVIQLYRLSLRHKEREQYHAYYAIPVLIGFLLTYGIIQLFVRRYPDAHFSANGYHIHHYTYGIIILLIFGYIGLWTRNMKMKYLCALAHGVGAAFIIDEAFMWFTLTNIDRYQDYDLVFFVVAILISIILAPFLVDGKKETNKE